MTGKNFLLASQISSVAKGNRDLPATEPTELFCPHELLNRCLGNVEFATRILDRFLSCLPMELQNLEQVHKSRDALGVARIAHRMKGAAANISARRLHWLMSILEATSRQQAVPDMDELVSSARKEAQKLVELVEQWRNQVGSSKWSFSPQGVREEAPPTTKGVDPNV
jgi:HPt (histidine-containing phosphotransfer) domain-containing protein